MPEIVNATNRKYRGLGAPPKYDEEIKSILDKNGVALYEKNRNTKMVIADRARNLGYYVKEKKLTQGGWDIFIQTKPFEDK